jgi:glycosyltransferase involved in cell wall biosynthesis
MEDIGNKQSISILTSVHPVFDTRIFHKEAKTLANEGYKVTLIAKHDKSETIDNIKIVALSSTNSRLSRMFGIWQVLRIAIKQNSAVCHFHDPELLIIVPFLKLFTHGKIIYDVHENIRYAILNKEWIPRFIRKPVSFCYRIIEKMVLPCIDKIILAEDSYVNNYKNSSKSVVIRNYVIQNIRNMDSEYISSPDIIYIGGITEGRGVMEMLESVNLLKDKYKNIKLTMVGPIYSDTLKTRIANLINNYNIVDNVEFTGRVEHEKVYDIILKNSICLSLLHPEPNYIESLPTKLFEYMLCSKPVIASNFPLWKTIVEDNKCGLTVNPFNIKEISNAIKYLVEHTDEARHMGENGKKAVKEKYNWEGEGKKLLEIYKDLIRVK